MEKLIVCCLLFFPFAWVDARCNLLFTEIEGACILDHNTLILRGVSEFTCRWACLLDPTCRSFEYRADRRVCHTSTLCSADIEYFNNPCHVTGYSLWDRNSNCHPSECEYGDTWLDITEEPYTIPTTGWTEIWNKRPAHCKVQGVLQLTPPAGKTAVQLELTFDGPYGQVVFDIADLPTTSGSCGNDAEVWGFHDSFRVCSADGVLVIDRDETLKEKFTIQLGDGKMRVSNFIDWGMFFAINLFVMDGTNPIWFGVNHGTKVDKLKWGDGLCTVCVTWYDNWEVLPDLPLTTGDKLPCLSGEFQCDDDTCIPDALVCDGNNDCPDGEDEPDSCPCEAGEYKCYSGLCIPGGDVCNGVAECPDGDDEPDTCFCPNGDVYLNITSSPYIIPTTGWTELWNNGDTHSCKIQGVLRLTPPAGKTAVNIDMVLDGPYGKTVFDIADLPNTIGPGGQCSLGAEVYGAGEGGGHNKIAVCRESGGVAFQLDETLRTGPFTVQLGPNNFAVTNYWDVNELLLGVDLFDMRSSIWFGVNHGSDVDILKWGDGLCAVCVTWYDSWDDLPALPPV